MVANHISAGRRAAPGGRGRAGPARGVPGVAAGCVLAALALLSLPGCSLFSQEEEELTVEEQFQKATELANDGDVDGAIAEYNNLISTFPQSKHAQQALLEIAYQNYKAKRYDEAVQSADKFIQEYPNHSRLDYAHYLVGLAHFREDRGFLDFLGNEDPAERDREEMIQSHERFTLLIEQFPDSVYRQDSVERLRYLINALARHEVKVARYYLSREAWIAAINRAKTVLERFPDSTSNEEALAILVAAYRGAGLRQPADDALRVLRLNFPDSGLTEPAIAGAQPLLDRLDPDRYEDDWLFSLFD